MYLRHFAFTRLPFETPAETDELFESSARREAEARLGHLIELRGHRPAHRRGGVRQDHCLPTPHRAAPPCCSASLFDPLESKEINTLPR